MPAVPKSKGDLITRHPNSWRSMLQTKASFAGVMFHVENGGRTSGRRTVVHEYPKRNEPYSEDMGKHALRFQFSAYLIYRPAAPNYEYTSQRIRLYNALEKDDGDTLIHPVFAPGGVKVMCERYTMTESRERGGYTQFDMAFVELGAPVAAGGFANTIANVFSAAGGMSSLLTNPTSMINQLASTAVTVQGNALQDMLDSVGMDRTK